MPWPRPYKSFMQSTQWKKLRAYHRKHHPFCERCLAKGIHTPATEVHHKRKCFDDPQLQIDPNNLESICAQCHDEISALTRRPYSLEMDADGFFTDSNHPSNRAGHRTPLRFGRDATKIKPPGGGDQNITRDALGTGGGKSRSACIPSCPPISKG